jgi:hypothetical protein
MAPLKVDHAGQAGHVGHSYKECVPFVPLQTTLMAGHFRKFVPFVPFVPVIKESKAEER